MSWFLQNLNKYFFDIFAFTNGKVLFCLKKISRQIIEKGIDSSNIFNYLLKIEMSEIVPICIHHSIYPGHEYYIKYYQ